LEAAIEEVLDAVGEIEVPPRLTTMLSTSFKLKLSSTTMMEIGKVIGSY
jgi:hypothetical protein